jgi:hypothetical protein
MCKGSGASAEASVHARAFGHAVGKVFGGDHEFELKFPSPLMLIDGKNYHGCTDGLIALHMAQSAFNVAPADGMGKLQAVFEEMYQYVRSKTDAEVVQGIASLPGVTRTLTLLANDYKDSVLCGLVTGNVEGIARIKMRACGIFATDCLSGPSDLQLWRGDEAHAFLGGFGSDFCSGDTSDASRVYKDRGEQICIAYKRALTLLKPNERIRRVVHIGDAPADILAAKMCHEENRFGDEVAVGCVGVATGKFSADELQSLVGQPLKGRWEPVVLSDGINDPSFLKCCGLVVSDTSAISNCR